MALASRQTIFLELHWRADSGQAKLSKLSRGSWFAGAGFVARQCGKICLAGDAGRCLRAVEKGGQAALGGLFGKNMSGMIASGNSAGLNGPLLMEFMR